VSCIYCGSNGPFTREHVFPRSLGGSDAKEWVLESVVCEKCNNKFSSFEREFIQETIPINLMRLKYGPRGRTGKPVKPIRLEYLGGGYNKPETAYVHEGFKPEYPPQITITAEYEAGFTAKNHEEGEAFLKQIRDLVDSHVLLNVKRHKGIREYFWLEIASGSVIVCETLREAKSVSRKNVFVVIRNSESKIPTRITRNPDRAIVLICGDLKKGASDLALFLRSIKHDLYEFIGDLARSERTEDKTPQLHRKGKIHLPTMARFTAKTGLNFFYKVMGFDFIMNPVFADIKRFILGEEIWRYGKPGWPFTFGTPASIKPLFDRNWHTAILNSNKHGYVFILNLFGGWTGTVRLSEVYLKRPCSAFYRVLYNELKIEAFTPATICELFESYDNGIEEASA